MRVLIIALLLATSLFSTASNDLKKIIATADTATSIVTFQNLANETEQITPANNKNWLLYYWSAFNYAMSGYLAPKMQKDLFLDKADELITKALLLNPNEAELYILQSWVYSSKIAVAPASRAKPFGEKSKAAQEKAVKLAPNNPRVAFIQGAMLYNTPPAMGGNKADAKKYFDEAISKFSSYKPISDAHPNWGKSQTLKYLESYQ